MDRIDNLKDELGEEEEIEQVEEADEEEQEEEESEEGDDEESDEESDDEEEADEEEGDEEEEEFEIPDKFKGKSLPEVIQSYQALEKLMGQRTLTKTERKDLKKLGLERGDVEGMEKMKELIEGTDFTKMNPQQFASWILEQTTKQADDRAREIYQKASTVKQAVKTEIGEATEQYPLLKSNKEFRNLTLAVIEADAAQGKMTPIIEAAGKVAALMKGEEKATTKKKNVKLRKRTAVETKGSGAGGKKKTDQEDVAARVLGAGNKADTPLGGLGI